MWVRVCEGVWVCVILRLCVCVCVCFSVRGLFVLYLTIEFIHGGNTRACLYICRCTQRVRTGNIHEHTQVNEPICIEFGKASAIDFKMDRPPSEDFKLVMNAHMECVHMCIHVSMCLCVCVCRCVDVFVCVYIYR